jgi:hypothetical protein
MRWLRSNPGNGEPLSSTAKPLGDTNTFRPNTASMGIACRPGPARVGTQLTPQGNPKNTLQQLCPGGTSFNFTAQQGLFANFDTKIGGISANVGVNLVSYNTPLNGAPYLSQGFNLSLQVAVGTPIAERPPHRSVRAALPHTAPTLGVWRRSGCTARDAPRGQRGTSAPPSA